LSIPVFLIATLGADAITRILILDQSLNEAAASGFRVISQRPSTSFIVYLPILVIAISSALMQIKGRIKLSIWCFILFQSMVVIGWILVYWRSAESILNQNWTASAFVLAFGFFFSLLVMIISLAVALFAQRGRESI
jgi:hypothetical protein